MPIDAAYARVERLVKDLKALSPTARRAYTEDNTRKNFIHDRIVALMEEMLQLQKDHAATPPEIDSKRSALQKRITQVDEEIDQIVDELYGLA